MCKGILFPASTVITIPPLAEQRSACASYIAPISITEPAKANRHNCATPVRGSATASIPNTWEEGLPFQPFGNPKSLIADFCDLLERFGHIIKPGIPTDDTESPGECHTFHVDLAQTDLALYNYRVTITLAFDHNGCDGPSDKYRHGIDFTNYGSRKCQDRFKHDLVDKCRFPHAIVGKSTNMGPNEWIGGVLWKDCLRWTVIAADEKFRAPETLPQLGGVRSH